MTQAALLEHVTKTIIERFHPKRIILFGSYARGEARPDSDLDVFIEMESTQRPPDRAIQVSEAFGLRPWPMDIIVYTPGGNSPIAPGQRHPSLSDREGGQGLV
jgi:UTP:GlnB (protein PII) uridylyltransferase